MTVRSSSFTIPACYLGSSSPVFDWDNSNNGRLLAGMGILSALLQGGYTRTATRKIGEGVMARRGVISCAIGLIILVILPFLDDVWAPRALYLAAAFLAFTSATVVSSLTAFASLQCDDEPEPELPDLAKGRALGKFRSSGQLGRAIGPLLGELIRRAVTTVILTTSSLCIVLDLWTLDYLCHGGSVGHFTVFYYEKHHKVIVDAICRHIIYSTETF